MATVAVSSLSSSVDALTSHIDKLHVSPPIDIPSRTGDRKVNDTFKQKMDSFSQQTERRAARPWLSGSCTDLYTDNSLVFKPGEKEATVSSTVYELMKMCGLEDVVPETHRGLLAQAIASKDLDDDRQVKYSLRKDVRGRDLAVRQDSIFTLEMDENGVSLQSEAEESPIYGLQVNGTDAGKCTLSPLKTKLDAYLDNEFIPVVAETLSYLAPRSLLKKTCPTGQESKYLTAVRQDLDEEETVYILKEFCIPFHNSDQVIVEDQIYSVCQDEYNYFLRLPECSLDEHVDTEFYILKQTDTSLVVAPVDASELLVNGFVVRKGIRYKLKVDSTNRQICRLVAEKIPGAYQEKKGNLFEDLNVVKDSPKREKLYQKIDMNSFIRAFVASAILGTPDLKVCELKESNVLFQYEGEKVKTVLIDLDEMLPKDRTVTEEGVCVIRNGLMGFPHALKPLEADELAMLYSLLKKCVEVKTLCQGYLEKTLGAEEAASYTAVVDAIAKILEKKPATLSLQELFFTLYPVYKEHWDKFPFYENLHQRALVVGDLNPDMRT